MVVPVVIAEFRYGTPLSLPREVPKPTNRTRT